MLWTGLAIRCQLRRPIPIVYIRSVISTPILFASRGVPGSLQNVSTRQPTGDESSSVIAVKLDEIFSTKPEILLKSSTQLPDVKSAPRKKCRRPRSRAKSKHVAIEDPVVEHIKTEKRRIKALNLRVAVAHSRESREVWKATPEYRKCIRDRSGSLKIMAQTNSPSLAWEAYQDAASQSIHIPFPLLDRVFRVLIRSYAPTRRTFLRLHEISSHIRKQGGQIKLWQWNALIYHSALALRKVHTKDYQAALDIYREMMSVQEGPGKVKKLRPDVWTYTTLVYIAIRTGIAINIQHAYSLFRASNLVPDRVARLAIIPYYTSIKKLRPIRRIALDFSESRQDIGLDGINAYMWAFGKQGYLDVMERVYQALRNNMHHNNSSEAVESAAEIGVPSTPPSTIIKHARSSFQDINDSHTTRAHPRESDVDDTLAFLEWPPTPLPVDTDSIPSSKRQTLSSSQDTPYQLVNGSLAIWNHHVPNHITYAICIQVHAFNGDFTRALQIFRDMITSEKDEGYLGATETSSKAIHKVYRALFLGFARHTRKPELLDTEERKELQVEVEENSWVENALDIAFSGFLNMDVDQSRPNTRTVIWILHAFSNINQGDTEKLVEVWRSLEERFGTLRVPRSFRHIAKAARQDETNVNPGRIVYNTSE